MSRIHPLWTVLVAASLALSARAGDPAQLAPPATEPTATHQPVHVGHAKRGKLANFLFGKREHLPPGYARPILIDGNVQYEPKLRDIRFVPLSSTLPGSGLGAPDTLPVIPPYRNGYYRINYFR